MGRGGAKFRSWSLFRRLLRERVQSEMPERGLAVGQRVRELAERSELLDGGRGGGDIQSELTEVGKEDGDFGD